MGEAVQVWESMHVFVRAGGEEICIRSAVLAVRGQGVADPWPTEMGHFLPFRCF